MKDCRTFDMKDGQTQIRSENNIKTGTTRGMPLHHP